jgi:1,4-dihydroxy-2-naphthoate octaprenyltransferase
MKNNCPNIDKDTLSGLKKIGIKMNIENRKILFYTLCVVLRLFIAGLVYQLKDKHWLPYIIILFSLLIIYRLHDKIDGNFWWSRKFHMFICFLLIVVSVLKINGYVDGKYLSYLLYIDVGFGFLHSLTIKRC